MRCLLRKGTDSKQSQARRMAIWTANSKAVKVGF